MTPTKNKKWKVRKKVWELFRDEEWRDLESNLESESLTGPQITTEEIGRAIQQSKKNKAFGPDQLAPLIFKLVEDHYLSLVEIIFIKTYNKGKFPLDLLKSTGYLKNPMQEAAMNTDS